ncbi:putative lipid-binding protein AIR1B [Solanum verrucosum]|uniref:putative lipid-binding protein AIR1B n=1 Tax=Solanum verrucosum TaxID=315347 RepID=UPI0020D1EBCA|nr:putative lipid-binding protein AIR1B [Solanum verrucosum]
MASKTSHPSVALFLSLNLVLFALVSGTNDTGNCGGQQTCSIDTLKLGVCANILNLVNVVVGSPPTLPCCSLIQGLLDLAAVVCLRLAIRANIVGIINLEVPLAIDLILSACGRSLPTNSTC